MRHVVGVTQAPFNVHALQFDGAASYAETSNTDLPTAALSVSAWIRPNQAFVFATTYRLLYDVGFGFQLTKAGASNDLAGFSIIFSTSGNTSQFSASPFVINTWAHLLLTFDGTNMRSYFNGTLNGTTNRSGQTVVWGTSTPLIRASRNSSQYNAIAIDEVSIWNRAVSVAEVAAANLPIDLTGASGLVRWYRMGDYYVPGSFSIAEQVAGTYPMTLINAIETTDFVSAP